MQNQYLEETKSFVEEYFAKHVGKEYSYHNFEHTSRVVKAADQLANEAHLSEDEKELLLLAAWFHDVGFGVSIENHEKHSTEIAQQFLSGIGYPPEKVNMVSKLIMATKMDWKGEDKMCCLIKDADLSGLANPNYQSIAENLRKEKNATLDAELDEVEWIHENIKFLQSHFYCSEEGKRLFNEGKEKNLEQLKMMENGEQNDIQATKKKKKKKKKKSKLLTIGSSKSAQTQLKTALRNHIDLSAIADNKANIMLSVNAIVITVGIPLLVEQAYTNPDMIIPTVILAFSSLVSMIFATLSTRPAKMPGVTSPDSIKTKKSNLFFFGNYFKMDFDQYETGMRTVVGDNEILDNSITRDLFFLGKSLGKKYEYLRICYNIFMFGVALSVISFVVVKLAAQF
ncbi:MAG: HD domain-containing protein [Saprospiraceae bacterium]|nr:HD domain-containing protein [Saprospiraceae bacterium]